MLAARLGARERVITREMLERAEGIVVCNALRGMPDMSAVSTSARAWSPISAAMLVILGPSFMVRW
jgi:branched-subunit amino acid aminotransferase/4-amino-4-deoxychorismate lyase